MSTDDSNIIDQAWAPAPGALFDLGDTIICSSKAHAKLQQLATTAIPYLRRHEAGDWGEGNAEKNEENRGYGCFTILSVYPLGDGESLQVFTDLTWQQTFVLLRSEDDLSVPLMKHTDDPEECGACETMARALIREDDEGEVYAYCRACGAVVIHWVNVQKRRCETDDCERVSCAHGPSACSRHCPECATARSAGPVS
jgi:hypothetical protein